LEQVAALNLERLKTRGDWVVFPPVIWDFARGAYAADEQGELCYRTGNTWHPVETVVHGPTGKEIIFRDSGAQ